MNSIENVRGALGSDADWSIPVRVQVGKRAPETINNPAQALIYLHDRWPRPRGKYHEEATVMCGLALRRRISANVARETFVSATLEAAILAP